MLLDFEWADKGLDGQIAESVASTAITCQFLCIVAINDLPMSAKREWWWKECLFQYLVFVEIASCCGCRWGLIWCSPASKMRVTRNNIVWKLAHGYCLCYCKTFWLVPDFAECTKFFLPKCAVHYLYHLKSNNVIDQRENHQYRKALLSMIDFI